MATMITRYGSPAVVALRDAIARCREGALLKPITIIVPSVAVGMPVLQELARLPEGASETSSSSQGVFGVRHWTAAGLAKHILNFCEPAHRRPRNDRVVAAALRQIDDFGVFQPVRHHEATEQVLVSTLKELERLSGEDLEKLGDLPSQRARDLLRLELEVREVLGGDWLSNSQTMQRAVEAAQESLRLSSDNRLRLELGSVIVFLPQQISRAEGELLRLCHPEAVIIALTGAAEADRPVLRCAQLLDSSFAAEVSGGSAAEPVAAPLAPSSPFVPSAASTFVVSAPTAEDEIRLAVRSVMEALREGVPADRLAIAFASREPYARILVDQLRDAGISFSIASGFPLHERIAPKTVLALLQLEASDYGRTDLINLLASAPIVFAERPTGKDRQRVQREPVPVAAWDRVSRKAKVARGQWEVCLQRFIELQEKEISRKTDDADLDERRASYAKREIYYAKSLLRFVKQLEEDVKKVALAETWHAKANAVRYLVDRYIRIGENFQSPDASQNSGTAETSQNGSIAERLAWSEEEAAKEELFKILTRLEALQDIELAPSHRNFIQALTQELEENKKRMGSQGIRLLNVDTLLTESMDRLWILGLAEGLFPQKLHEDSLLPDSDRELVPDLAPRSDRVHEQQRHFLAALQLPSQKLTLSYSRQGGKGENLPSRWLLDVVQALCGRSVFAEELDTFLQSLGEGSQAGTEKLLGVDEKRLAGKFVASATADLLEAAFPAVEQEFNLRCLLPELTGKGARQRAEAIADSSPSNEALRAGVKMLQARASSRFTRFDGNLLDEDIADKSEIQAWLSARLSEPFSPSRLQDWVGCPHAFFMSSILGVRPLEEVEEMERLSPLVRGEIIHDALEKFFKEEMENAGSPLHNPDLAWDDIHKDRLSKTAAKLCDSAKDENRFGLPLYHAQEQQAVLEDLCMFLDDDSAYRRQTRSKPLALEAEFGYHGQPEPAHKLPDGTEIKLRGRIDRIDIRDSPDTPTEFVVIDYKTGKHNAGEKHQQYKNLSEFNPHGQGRRLQLPLYASAALELPVLKERIEGSVGAKVSEAIYWFVTSQSDFYREPIVLSPDALGEVSKALQVVHSGIRQGLFPSGVHKASLAGVACEWCNPDRFGPSRHDVGRKLNSSLLRPWLELAYPESLDEKASEAKAGETKTRKAAEDGS